MPSQHNVDALLDAYTDRARALDRVLWLIAHHSHQVAAEPSLVLQAMDAHPAATAWCPPGCTGDCTPDPALKARLDTTTAAPALKG
jgi:hypothetical protein